MKFHSKRATAFASLVLTGALVLTACGGSDDDTASGGGSDEVSVTFLPKNLGNPYFDVTARGGEAAVEEFGGTFDQVGPQEATPDAQTVDTCGVHGCGGTPSRSLVRGIARTRAPRDRTAAPSVGAAFGSASSRAGRVDGRVGR